MATKAELLVENWNLKHPEGQAVEFWTFTREGAGKTGKTWTPAMVSASGDPVVYIRDDSGKNVGMVLLTHVSAR